MERYRFYHPALDADASNPPLALSEPEAHHARNVLRLTPGAQVVLFDGMGAWAQAELTRVDKRGVWAQRQGPPTREPPPAPALTIATAVPKGERAEWLIEQASQLNVTAVQFIDCQRSVVKPEQRGAKIEKWHRLALESAKQCGRAHLLHVEGPVKLASICPSAAPSAGTPRVLWLDPVPEGTTVPEALADWHGPILALIGPEGGWSDTERKTLETAAAAGDLKRVHLTQTVLRIETACAAVASLVMAR